MSTARLSSERYRELVQRVYDELIKEGTVPTKNNVGRAGKINKVQVARYWPGAPPAGMKTRCMHCSGMFGPNERYTTYTCKKCAYKIKHKSRHNPDAIPWAPLKKRAEALRVHREYLLKIGVEGTMTECAKRLGWSFSVVQKLWPQTTPVLHIVRAPAMMDNDPWQHIKIYGTDLPGMHAQCCPMR